MNMFTAAWLTCRHFCRYNLVSVFSFNAVCQQRKNLQIIINLIEVQEEKVFDH